MQQPEALSESSDSELEQPLQLNPPAIEQDDDDEYGQEDHDMDDDEGDMVDMDDDNEEEEEVEPELMHIEDDLDDYDEEEEQMIEDGRIGDMLFMRGERRGGAVQNDIINPNVRGDNNDPHHLGWNPRYGMDRQ